VATPSLPPPKQKKTKKQFSVFFGLFTPLSFPFVMRDFVFGEFSPLGEIVFGNFRFKNRLKKIN
jgi:hypothetical protein